MPADFKADSLYQDVAALSDATSDTVIPNGETWHVHMLCASGAYLDDTVVKLLWDGTILAAAHGDNCIPVRQTFTGDGVKAIRIELTNDTTSSHVLGGRWDGSKQ